MPIILHQDVFRPAPPASDLPFTVRSTGYYKIQPPFTSIDRKIYFLQLFWCTRGSGIVEFDGRRRVLKQNQVALYYPNMRHLWYADRKPWDFYWLTINGPLAVSVPAGFGLEAGIYNAGPAPAALFRKLRRLVGQPSKQAELRACAIAFTVFTRAAGSQADQTDELINKAVERMHEEYALPELNIKTLAAALGERRARFSVRFQTVMGMLPSAYLERLRVQKALSLLQHTHLSIAAAASQCGYADANYFSRVIRRITGGPPFRFRKPKYLSSDKQKGISPK